MDRHLHFGSPQRGQGKTTDARSARSRSRGPGRFGGRPPLRPLRRAAFFFAGDDRVPPIRPNSAATADVNGRPLGGGPPGAWLFIYRRILTQALFLDPQFGRRERPPGHPRDDSHGGAIKGTTARDRSDSRCRDRSAHRRHSFPIHPTAVASNPCVAQTRGDCAVPRLPLLV